MPLLMIARMNLHDIDISPPKRLAHVPLIMDVIRRMGVMEIIDSACGTDRRMKSSHGECVAVILAGVFTGEHGLWRLQDRLDVFDMTTVMQDPGFDLAEFHDVRLGRSLDAIYRAGPDKILTELALRTIAGYDLAIDYMSFDTTSLTFFGAYEHEMDPGWSPEEDEGVDVTAVPERRGRHSDLISGDGREAPRVVHGYAKNRRHDLKQILYGSVVTRDGGVPLYGRAMDGNTSDVTAAAAFLDALRRELPDPGQRCFVADSKGWTPTVLDQVRRHRLRLLSRLPRTTGLSRECLDAFDAQRAPCLLRRHHPRRKRWSWVALRVATRSTPTVGNTSRPMGTVKSDASAKTPSFRSECRKTPLRRRRAHPEGPGCARHQQQRLCAGAVRTGNSGEVGRRCVECAL